ncbi:MAG: hypothetical protein IKP38_09355 [Clostridia bacterium]|nr:hypothetical protein [Clostridia bacterium]
MKRAKRLFFYDDREARRLQEQIWDRPLKRYPPYYPNEQLSMADPEIGCRIYR